MSFNPCVQCNAIPSVVYGIVSNIARVRCNCARMVCGNETAEEEWNAANPLPSMFVPDCRDSDYLVQIEELKKQLEEERKKNMWSIPVSQCTIIAKDQTLIDTLRQEIASLKKRLKETEEKWHAIQDDRTRTRWKLNDIEFHNKRLSAEINSLEKQLASKSAKCERQAQELRKMNAKVNEHCAGCRHKGAAEDMAARDLEIKVLQKQINERDEKIVELTNGNKHLCGITQRINANDAATYKCMADVRKAVREWDRCVAATERA